MRPITIQFLKNPDIAHWGFEGVFLGKDDFGSWVAVPKGAKRWKGDVPFRPTQEDAVFCAPHDGWWHLHYNGPLRTDLSHFVDIVTPPVWVSEHRYEMIDLDLDVTVGRNGKVLVEDEDEFEIHQVKYGYDVEMIERAIAETALIVAALENREEPFFDVAEAWLGRVESV